MPLVTLNSYRILESVRFYPPATIREAFGQVLRLDPKLQHLVAVSGGEANVFEIIYGALQESVRDSNNDKKYWLEKLRDSNAEAERLLAYLAELVDASGGHFVGPYRCKSKKEPLSWMLGRC